MSKLHLLLIILTLSTVAFAQDVEKRVRTHPILLINPSGGELYVPGRSQGIILGVKTRAKSLLVELSRDGGASFETVGTIDNTVKDRALRNKLNWTPALPESGSCVIRVTSTDDRRPGSILSKEFSIGSPELDTSTPDGRYVLITGDTMTGSLTLSGDPIQNLGAATKQYVDMKDTTHDVDISGKVNKIGDSMTGRLAITVASTSRALEVLKTGANAEAGFFQIDNATNAASAFIASTNGTGRAAAFGTTNSSGTGTTLVAETSALGAVAELRCLNVSNGNDALIASTAGLGRAGHFRISNTSNSANAILAVTSGTGTALLVDQSGSAGDIAAFQSNTVTVARIDKKGRGYFNGGVTVANTTNGRGVNVIVTGVGEAGNFEINNAANTNASLRTATNSNGPAFVAVNSASGAGAAIYSSNTTSSSQTLYVENKGTSNACLFQTINTSNSATVLHTLTKGTGSAGLFQIDNISSGGSALAVSTNGTGRAFSGATSGIGTAGHFENTNTSSVGHGVYGFNAGGGAGIRGVNGGTGSAGSFITNTTTNSSNILESQTFGTGRAGFFKIQNSSSTAESVRITTIGTGTSLAVDHLGTSGDIAVFQSNTTNVARIDKTGKGFFNGGTQNSGADLAEAVAVTGTRNGYEPGDVMIISPVKALHFKRSCEPYSKLVAGVYATKPGVLLTERDVANSDLQDLVPMGVVGIIPTKVSSENGAIKLGDLLVTSSKPGHAMKGTDTSRMLGAIIGKAMEEFNGSGTGVIKVLVNVK